jgi:hypothetical protein
MPPDLTEHLNRWQRVFDTHYHHMTGWPDDQVKDRWADEARSLADEVRAHLPVGYVLDVNLWPLKQA